MALTDGTRIGPYEVTSRLGEGGMGVVFRAHDTKLQRDVALKLLPDHFSNDPERLARFQREAQVLASLNHPNIAQIYGLEDSTAQRCIVMELVEGETLQERLKRGPIPVDEALPMAKQIAAALEIAHDKGIIHRDLKPANLKMTPDGQVKVLDFGLAKAFDEGPESRVSDSPTLMSASIPGVILGTAAYMAPEQAKGRAVDRRADIFAFGCVLYEMLTGRRVFDGEDVTEILGRVVTAEPDWSRLPAELPASIRRLLRRSLKKDPRQRLGDMRDARIEIEEAGMDAEASAASESTRGARLAWTAAVVAALVAAVLAAIHLREAPPPSPPEMRVEINTPATPQPLHFSISLDGRQIVFVASGNGTQRLWLRTLDAVAARPLAGTEGAEYPFWSPDGRSIGFFASGKLKRIDTSGGLPQPVTDAPAARGGTWNSDGTILFAPTSRSPLLRVPASGGQPVQVTKLDPPHQVSHRFPQFLPDGRHFLFFSQGNVEEQGIYLGSLDDAAAKRLASADIAGAYMDPGWVLFNDQGVLVARRLDVTHAAMVGDPVTLADSASFDLPFNLGGFSASSAGIAYRARGSERRQLIWFDRTGKAVGAVGEPDVNTLQNVDLSPDGRRVVVTRSVQLNFDVFLIDVTRGSLTRSTFDPANDLATVWSPDGMRIVFTSNRKGIYDLYMKPSSGAGEDELLLESPNFKIPMHWSPDGRFLLYTEVDPKTGYDLWALPIAGEAQGRAERERSAKPQEKAAALNNDRKPVPVVHTPQEERGGQFSPDGRWVAYQSNENGRFEIYVQPFPAGSGKWQVSTAGGTDPRWRHDGKELFFMSPDAKLMAAPVEASGATFEAASPVVLFQTRAAAGGNANLKQQYDVSRDGRFLINQATEESTAPITLILNWRPPLK
jgi:eukaryotic-like serine/threonine-protein kinase